MKQNKKQKSFGNSFSVENLDYPIVIEIPDDYWNFTNFLNFKLEYLEKK